MQEVQVGRFRIRALCESTFALDGGAMFGVVPRALWQKLTPVNDDHTIPLVCNAFLVEDGENVVLIEPGIGERWSDKYKTMYHIEHPDGGLAAVLKDAGRTPEEVTHVVMSHAHFDHIGAVCGVDGMPLFNNARHFLPEIEKNAVLNPDHFRRASYRCEDLKPVVDAGLLETFSGSCEVLPGLNIHELGGHSDGVSVVVIEDAGTTACFWSDVVPTRNHVALPFIMAYDMDAEESFRVRSEWIERATSGDWIGMMYHDPEHAFLKFSFDGSRYAWSPLTAASD
ncbi:MAG: hypothetical protein COB96_01070 [Planctomycetota bacterium]|nr:MAG: hypothetical protein COB96_01070 [Planctomycetota bacterium]